MTISRRIWLTLDTVTFCILTASLLVGFRSLWNPAFSEMWGWIFSASIAAAAYVMGRRCWVLWTLERPNWRRELGLFLWVYIAVILGFAGMYYLIRQDFLLGVDAKSEDRALAELNDDHDKAKTDLEKREAEIPAAQNAAREEYEKAQRITSEISRFYVMLAPPLKIPTTSRERPEPEPRTLVLSAQLPSAVIEAQIRVLEDERRTLNPELIKKYEDDLSAKRRVEDAARRVAAAKASIERYPYLNFVYFSTVTIATVGYGDIVPRRIRAKMLVVLEILLGSGLVLVYLTIIVGGLRERTVT